MKTALVAFALLAGIGGYATVLYGRSRRHEVLAYLLFLVSAVSMVVIALVP